MSTVTSIKPTTGPGAGPGTGSVAWADPRHLAGTLLRVVTGGAARPSTAGGDAVGSSGGLRALAGPCRVVDDPAAAGPSGVPTGPGTPGAGLAVAARLLDELAAIVEDERRREDQAVAAAQELVRDGHAQELLAAQHGRRCTVLRLLAEHLGELHGDLDEIAAQLAAGLGDVRQPTGADGVGVQGVGAQGVGIEDSAIEDSAHEGAETTAGVRS